MKLIFIFISFFFLISSAYSSEATFKQAYQAFLKKDYPSAQKLIQAGSLPPNHPLADYSLWILGKSALENKNYEIALPPLQKLINSYGASFFHSPAKIAFAKIYFEKEEYSKVKEFLNRELNSLEKNSKGEALYYLGSSEISLGEGSAGYTHLKEAYAQYPTAATDSKVRLLLEVNPPKISIRPEDQFERADHLAEEKDWVQAIEFYDLVLKSSVSPLREIVRIKEGISLYRSRKYSTAIPYLTFNEKLKIPSELAREALLDLAISYQRLEKLKEATQTFEKLAKIYPQTNEGEEALFRLGQIKFGQGNFSEAISIFEKLNQTYPQGKFRDRALFLAAWNAYRLLNWEQAVHFLSLMETSDDPTKAKSFYWQGRILEKQEKSQEAKQFFEKAVQASPFSYYGFLALKKLQDLKDLTETPLLPKEWKIVKTSPISKAKKVTSLVFGDHYRKAIALYSLGFGKQSILEFDQWMDDIGEDSYLLSETLKNSRNSPPYVQVRIGQKYWDQFKKVFPNPASAEQYRIFLQSPFAYRPWVEKFAREFSVPPTLVWALMKQESAFQPWATSPMKAQGLMQLIPATANQRGVAIHYVPTDLFDPAQNIRIGTAELAAQLKRYSGNWVAMMIAYNAGPRRATEWLAQNGDLQMDEFIEEIPFSETNLYVKLVFRNYWVYQALFLN